MDGKGISQQLDELGFTLGSIHETILVTLNPDGSPNAAPMGVIRVGPDGLEVRPFKSSTTHENILRRRRACVNLTDNPALFLVTAFKDERFEGLPAAAVDSNMRLCPSDASIFVEANVRKDVSEIRSSFACKVVAVESQLRAPRAFSRGRAAAIDAVIHATRIEVFSREGRRRDVERLIKRYCAVKDVIRRVSAPETVESRVIEELERMMEAWGLETSR